MLVLGGADDNGREIADAARDRGVPVVTVDLRDRRVSEHYGADLVLVRPDQHVAWRGDRAPDDPGALVDQVRGAPATGTLPPPVEPTLARTS